MPEPEPAGEFLHRGLGTGGDDLDDVGREGKAAQRRGGDAAGGEEIGRGNGAKIVEIGLDARNAGLGQRRL